VAASYRDAGVDGGNLAGGDYVVDLDVWELLYKIPSCSVSTVFHCIVEVNVNTTTATPGTVGWRGWSAR
jgi:hypothetical protein